MPYANVQGMGQVPVAPPDYYKSAQAQVGGNQNEAMMRAIMAMLNSQKNESSVSSENPQSSVVGENQIPTQAPSELFKFQRPPSYLSKIQEALRQSRGF